MALEMLQRITIGTSEEMMGDEPASSAMVFPYVRKVMLETSRSLPIDVLTAVLPRYAQQKIDKIKRGMVLRWEAGYKQDGKWLGDGLKEEFEGVITEVNYLTHYDGTDPNKILKRDNQRNGGFALTIQAKDYMYLCGQTPMTKGQYGGNGATMDMVMKELVDEVNAKWKINVNYDPKSSKKYNPKNVNPSNAIKITGVKGEHSVLRAFLYFHKLWDTEWHLGLDVYFRGKQIFLRDPNDPEYDDNERLPRFLVGGNVIDDDLVERPGKKIIVKTRCFDYEQGGFIRGEFPESPFEKKKAWRTGEKDVNLDADSIREFDIEGIKTPPEAKKQAENIFAEIAGDGFVGSFSTFGFPSVSHSNLMIFADRLNPERADRQKMVIIDRITKTYDAEAAKYTQVVYPGFSPTPIKNPLSIHAQPGKPVEVDNGAKPTGLPVKTQGFIDSAASFWREALSKK